MGRGAERGRVERHRAVAADFHAVDVEDAEVLHERHGDMRPCPRRQRGGTADHLFARVSGCGDAEPDCVRSTTGRC